MRDGPPVRCSKFCRNCSNASKIDAPGPFGPKPAPVDVTEVEERSLDTYDRIFGVIDGGLSTGEGAA